MEKTEKTMLELEIDFNQRAWEWSRLTESGASLQPLYGSGYTGMLVGFKLKLKYIKYRNYCLNNEN